MIDKKAALILALDDYMQQLRKSLDVYDVSDVPGIDTCYWALPGTKDDYWYVQHPADQDRPMQTGGASRYFAVSKQTGALHVITINGE